MRGVSLVHPIYDRSQRQTSREGGDGGKCDRNAGAVNAKMWQQKRRLVNDETGLRY